MNVRYHLFLKAVLSAILLLLLGHGTTYAQPKKSDTARRGPIFQMIGGLDHDFGKVDPKKRTDILQVTNPGDDTLRILDIRGSDPIYAVVRDDIILPGDTGTIDVHSPSWPGGFREITKAFTIRSNDPDNPQTMFRVTLHVTPYVALRKSLQENTIVESISLTMRPGHDTTVTVTLEATGDSSVVVSPASMTIINWEGKHPDVAFSSDMTEDIRLEPGEKRNVSLWFVLSSVAEKDPPFSPLTLEVDFPTSRPPQLLYCSVTIQPGK